MSEDIKECRHEQVKCLCCGRVGTPGQLLLSRKRGPRSPEGVEQSKQAAKKRRSEVTLLEVAEVLIDTKGEGVISYKGHQFSRGGAFAFFAEHVEITLGGAKKYIQTVVLEKGVGKVEGFPRISLQKAVEILVGKVGEGEVVYRGHLFTRKEAAEFMVQGRGINMKNAKEYIHGVLRGRRPSAQ